MAVCRRKCLLFLGARPALNLPTQACSLVDVVDPLIKNKELPKSPHTERESLDRGEGGAPPQIRHTVCCSSYPTSALDLSRYFLHKSSLVVNEESLGPTGSIWEKHNPRCGRVANIKYPERWCLATTAVAYISVHAFAHMATAVQQKHPGTCAHIASGSMSTTFRAVNSS